MPKYDYCCTKCSHTFEVTQPFESENKADCEKCGGNSKRIFTPPHIVFTGDGFYTTDKRENKAT